MKTISGHELWKEFAKHLDANEQASRSYRYAPYESAGNQRPLHKADL